MIGAGIFVALAPAAAAAGSGLLIGLGGRGRRRLLQRDVVGAAGRALSAVRRNLRVRPRAARRVLGLHRGLELRGRQDGLVRRDGADGRHLRLARVRACRRGGRGRGVDRDQLRGHPEVGAAHPRHRRGRARRARRGGGDRARLRRRRRLPRLFGDDGSVAGVLQAAGLLFFAFAGYARIATLGEEVRDPARTIPRAIPIALGITLAVYAIVAVGGLGGVGQRRPGVIERAAGRRRAGGGPARLRTGGPCRGRGRGAGVAAVADPRRVEDDAGDGPRPPPAPRAGRRASAVRQPAPRRAGRGCRRRGGRRGRRRARRDRLLLVRRAGLLRDRQRIGDDVGPQGDSGGRP